MAKKERVYQFTFASGTQTWGYNKGTIEDCGLYDPRFSRVEAVWQGTYPDPGVPEGKVPNMNFGERLGPEMIARVPAVVEVGRRTGKHPRDINVITDGEFGQNKIVSQRLNDVIEALEPGVHQFFPFHFINGVTREPIWTDVPWYWFNCTTWVAPDVLFDVEAMGDLIKHTTNPPYGQAKEERHNVSFSPLLRREDFIIRRSAVEAHLRSKHLWVTSRYFKDERNSVLIAPVSFCSQDFRLACKAAGLKGGHFTEFRIG